MSCRSSAVPLLVILCAGCAVRQPQTYRLVKAAGGRMLVPPGVASAAVERRTFKTDVAHGAGKCAPEGNAIEVRARGRGLRVTVARDPLVHQPAAWLSEWTAKAESNGCVAPGEGLKLANQVIESLPLDPDAADRLLHAGSIRAGYVDLGPENRLQVNSPILSEGTIVSLPEISEVRATGASSLQVDLKGPTNLLGFETAWYAIRPKAPGAGFAIVPVSAEKHIQGVVTPAAGPATNYLQFPPRAGYYRLFYKADQGTMKIMVVAGESRSELDRRTHAIAAEPGACEELGSSACVLIPKGVAVNPDVMVMVNGREVALPVGVRVRNAIVAGGAKDVESVLPRLRVRRLYGGKPVPVEFDRASTDILGLILSGGEEISWE